MSEPKKPARLALALVGAAALLACSRSGEAPARAPGPATPAGPAAAGAGLDARDAAALGLPSATMTRRYAGGRPVAWWSGRLERLRREGPEDLYRLTCARARLNGLEVVEKADGGVAIAVAAPAGADALGARP